MRTPIRLLDNDDVPGSRDRVEELFTELVDARAAVPAAPNNPPDTIVPRRAALGTRLGTASPAPPPAFRSDPDPVARTSGTAAPQAKERP
ncbi:hypothetical protein EEB14_25020 [Rhodococcus sp. WS4]|nr:hypothetical protein EEB14_25020 [Rhodococcus sp. WS4]